MGPHKKLQLIQRDLDLANVRLKEIQDDNHANLVALNKTVEVLGNLYKLYKVSDTPTLALSGEPNDTLHRLREFVETFLSMKILPDLIWWLQPELASKMPERKE